MFNSVNKILVIPVFLISTDVLAQDSHSHDKTLDELVVKAMPLGEQEDDIAQSISVLAGDELEVKKAATIGETLALELGVSSSDFGSAVGHPVIRGLGGPRVRVLEDGIGSLDLSTISADHAITVEPFLAQQIEVLKGPSTLLYGSGAIGGVVNVVNNRIPGFVPDRSISGQVLMLVNSSSNELTHMLDLNGGKDEFAWHLDGITRDSDDYEIPGFSTLENGIASEGTFGSVGNSDVDMESMAAGVSYIGDTGLVGIAVSEINNSYGLPGGHDHNHGGGGDDEGTRLDMSQTRFDMKARWLEPIKGFKKLSFRLGSNAYQHTELEENMPGTKFTNDETELRIELLHVPYKNWEGAIGLHYGTREFSAIGDEAYIPAVDSNFLGVFLAEHKHLENWSIELGARMENHEYQQSNSGMKLSYSISSFSSGMIYKINDQNSIGFTLSLSERAPSSEELFSNGPHLVSNTYERGDVNLQKETANNFDISYRGEFDNLHWVINLFQNNIDHYIYLESLDSNNDDMADRVDEQGLLVLDDDELLLVDYAQADAEFYGVEAEIVFNLSHNEFHDLKFRLFADSVSGKLVNGGRLPRMTPSRLGASLSHYHNKWRSNFDFVKINEQEDVAFLEKSTNGYDLVNINVGYTIHGARNDIDLFVKGTNLTNKDARRHTSFIKVHAPLPGRAWVFGAKMHF